MMKVSEKRLRELIKEELEDITSRMVAEGEDPFAVEDEGGEEEEAEEEGAEEEEETDEAEAEGGEEEAEEAGAEEIEITPGDEIQLGNSLEAQVDSMLVDFESNAIKSAEIQGRERVALDDALETQMQGEWYKRSLSNLLFEGEGEGPSLPPIDMETFTADVARLVMNYDNLLDIEAILINKARDFLRSKYDDDHVARFDELLDIRFGLDIEGSQKEQEEPMAVGARTPV